jgi:hypothetical protein
LHTEIQDIIDYKEYNTVNYLLQLAVLAEKELQGCQPTKMMTSFTLSLTFCRNLKMFPCRDTPGLPPLRGIEHQINLIPRATLPNRAAYRTNPEETKEMQRQVQELLDHMYVRESLSPCDVPVILVPKKNGTWRMCVDCRVIINITIRYHFPIPRLDDMLDELSGSIIFTNIDL